MTKKRRIAVIVPCYKVHKHILQVLESIPREVDHIVVVDDACPEKSGNLVAESISDSRVKVLFLEKNIGVGGAVLSGMCYAMESGSEILVKMDGDGQHDAAYISILVEPILQGAADYTKGNRFYKLESLIGMPAARIVGNAGLSFLTKLSSGYWNLMDPTNGFVAIHSKILCQLSLDKINKRYLFESDMLFRLGSLRAKVMQVPMRANYGNEISGITPAQHLLPMLVWHAKSFYKRIFYNYFLRGFSLASLFLMFGLISLLTGFSLGFKYWNYYTALGESAPNGPVMLVALMILLGINFLLNFFSLDMASEPREAIHMFLPSVISEQITYTNSISCVQPSD